MATWLVLAGSGLDVEVAEAEAAAAAVPVAVERYDLEDEPNCIEVYEVVVATATPTSVCV
jgi:hypothetical protein